MDSSQQPTAAKGPLITPEMRGTATAAALPITSQSTNNKAHDANDDDSDWEYEYSSTETETYYLTVDMSHKDLVKRPTFYITNTRGGYRVWDGGDETGKSTQASAFGDEDDNGGDDDQLPEPEPQDDENDDDMQNAPAPDQEDNEEDSSKEEEEDVAGEIQILDLHSEHPIISYRGRIFSASWATNIGTEMLFAKQDPAAAENPLPALRHLPGDVDLLAASSARLLTSQIELKRKDDGDGTQELTIEGQQANDRFAAVRRKYNLTIPVVGDRYGKRGPQARFLENLMAVKKMKGERDEVTVQTMETRQNEVEDDPAEMMERRKRARATERHRRNNLKRQERMRATMGSTYKPRGGGRPRGKGSRGPYKKRATVGLMAPGGGGTTPVLTSTSGPSENLAQPAEAIENDAAMQDGPGHNKINDNEGNQNED